MLHGISFIHVSLDGFILTAGVKTDGKSLHPMTVYAVVMNIPTSNINSYPVPHRFQINDNRSKGVCFRDCYLWIMAYSFLKESVHYYS